jgi:tetratricopeptide (TPR) repeat protein
VQIVRVARKAGWNDVILDAAERALERAPLHPELLVAAGLAAVDSGDPQVAISHLGLFLETASDPPDYLMSQARLAIGSCLDDVQQVFPAIAHCQCAKSVAGDDPNLCQTLAYLYRRTGDVDRALEVVDAGLRITPNHPALLLHSICANFESSRIEEAWTALRALESVTSDSNQIAQLQHLLSTSAPKPLLKQIEIPSPCSWIICNQCPARIPLASSSSVICARCGSVLDRGDRKCPHCSSTGRLTPAAGIEGWRCPYCRTGLLRTSDGD